MVSSHLSVTLLTRKSSWLEHFVVLTSMVCITAYSNTLNMQCDQENGLPDGARRMRLLACDGAVLGSTHARTIRV